jgi:hypothetical protein
LCLRERERERQAGSVLERESQAAMVAVRLP